MGNFKGGGRGNGGFRGAQGGGRPAFQKKGFKSGGGERAQMHKAVCSECGKSCEVPFRPSSDKPIYCNDCFSSKRGGEDRGERKSFDRGPKRDFNRPARESSFSKPSSDNSDMKNQLRDISAKLDKLIVSIEKLASSSVAQVEVKSTPTLKAIVKKSVVKKPVVKKSTKKAPAKKKK